MLAETAVMLWSLAIIILVSCSVIGTLLAANILVAIIIPLILEHRLGCASRLIAYPCPPPHYRLDILKNFTGFADIHTWQLNLKPSLRTNGKNSSGHRILKIGRA